MILALFFEYRNLFFQKQLLKFRRIRRLELHQISRYRMIETKFESMQRQTPERIGTAVDTVTPVSDQRMP